MRCAIVAALVLLPAVAAAGMLVDFEIVPKVLVGSKDRPTLTLRTVESCSDVIVKLTRDDGKTINARTGPMAAGASRKITIDVPQGREYRYSGTIEARGEKDDERIDLDFASEIVVPAKLALDKAKVDLEKRELEISSSRKTGKVEVEVKGDQGEDMGETTVPFEGAAPGTPLKVAWSQGEGKVMRITVKVWDTDNFYQSIELFPWHIYIPHEEVNFATGSFKIEPREEPKLTDSIKLIQDAVKKYGAFAEIKLYVAGHTDTVGSLESNRTLSLNRARSISEWFSRHGIKAPIFYEGFGEEALRIPTPDETDEIKNRRAEYIVAIEPPPVPYSRPASWKPLR